MRVLDGVGHWRSVQVDSCIAGIVRALSDGGVHMRGSCCGHGQAIGHIDLADGRGLLLLSPEQNQAYLSADGPSTGRVMAALCACDTCRHSVHDEDADGLLCGVLLGRDGTGLRLYCSTLGNRCGAWEAKEGE